MHHSKVCDALGDLACLANTDDKIDCICCSPSNGDIAMNGIKHIKVISQSIYKYPIRG